MNADDGKNGGSYLDARASEIKCLHVALGQPHVERLPVIEGYVHTGTGCGITRREGVRARCTAVENTRPSNTHVGSPSAHQSERVLRAALQLVHLRNVVGRTRLNTCIRNKSEPPPVLQRVALGHSG